MEKNHKNTDCYFFYYSTCAKGDSCAYRHEPSALGCETVCSFWQQGSCLNQHCNFRHMEIKKNRKVIPCYWEKFPTGCKKPHCPFLHRSARTGMPIDQVKSASVPAKPGSQEWSNRPDSKFDGNSTEQEPGRGGSDAGSFINSPVVDPLIVNFEEESDTESAPSPTKNLRGGLSSCKTYEEIRLEEIQAESAAYYSYESTEDQYSTPTTSGKMKRMSSGRSQRMSSVYGRDDVDDEADELDFKILSLDEIRKKKKKDAEEKAQSQECEVSEEELKKGQGEFLKKILRSLDHLRDTTMAMSKEASQAAESLIGSETTVTVVSPPVSERAKKRSFLDESSKDESSKKVRTAENTKVPPVRLRRTRVTTLEDSSENVEDKVAIQREEEEKAKQLEEEEKAKQRVDQERKVTDRLEEKTTEEVDASSSNRRTSVEVRVCDSSTDENQSTESVDDKEKKLMENADDISNLSTPTSDTKSFILDKTNLTAFETSDDILKDIDALLTDNLDS